MTNFTGTSGNDTFTGDLANDTFDLSQGGDDKASGFGGDDVFVMGGAFTAQDQLAGGSGDDTVVLNGNYLTQVVFSATMMTSIEELKLTATFDYNLKTSDATVAAGKILTVDGSTLGVTDNLTFDGSSETDGSFQVIGGAGADHIVDGANNDTIAGGGGADTLFANHGGLDTVAGGDGRDDIEMGAALTAADHIDGGADNDSVTLSGDYSAGLTFAAGTMINVETLIVADGFNYNLTVSDGTTGAGDTLRVTADALSAAHSLVFSAASETDGRVVVVDGAGDDTVTGGAGGDVVYLSNGGKDTFNGLAGDDVINVGAALKSSDRIQGGDGFDVVNFKGDYAAGITLSAKTIVGVESFFFFAGFDYSVTMTSLKAGKTLAVDASSLGAADSLSFDGQGVAGSFEFTGGAGDDQLTGANTTTKGDVFDLTKGGDDTASGGAGDDSFLMNDTFTAADSISGGLGRDTVHVAASSSFNLVFGANTMTGVESLSLDSDAQYALTIADATVAAGDSLDVFTGAGGADAVLIFDGSAETDGRLFLEGGNGDDVLTGGDSNDILLGGDGNDTLNGGGGSDEIIGGGSPPGGGGSYGNGNETVNGGGGDDKIEFHDSLTSDDSIDGGAGYDTVIISYKDVTFGPTTMVNVEELDVNVGQHPSHIVTDDATVAAGQTLKVVIAGKSNTNFDGSAETDGSFFFDARDRIKGGQLQGGSGDDTFQLHGATGTGHGGADLFQLDLGIGKGGPSIVKYLAAPDSTSTVFDHISGFHDGGDRIQLPFDVGAFDAAVDHSLSTATFDSDMAAIAANMTAHDAVFFHAGAGDYTGKGFVVVDFNGNAGYQAGEDLVIQIDTNSLALSTFIM